MDGVPPVFVRETDIPDGDSYPTVLEVCLAVEQSIGRNTVAGSQRLAGLWRIYATSIQARNDMLIQGFAIRGTLLKVCDINPNILRDSTTGEEKPATKVWIDQVPLSVADSEIENSLKKIGCEIRSSIKKQRARDRDGKLTRFLTGRRFLFITVPPQPLERKLKVCYYNASVWHEEQKQVRKVVKCSNCLETGHHHSSCDQEVVCIACRQPGHKRGSELCQIAGEAAERPAREATGAHEGQEPRGQDASTTAATADMAGTGNQKVVSSHAPAESSTTRGREPTRRATVQGKLEFRPRSGSKRPSSRDAKEDTDRAEKSMRIDNQNREESTHSSHAGSQPVTEDQGGELC